jgi:ABC-type sugar transport system substrate-binding protein
VLSLQAGTRSYCSVVKVSVLLFMCFFASASSSNELNILTEDTEAQCNQVILFVNSTATSPFTKSQVDFAQQVAKALPLSLDVHYVPEQYRNRFGIAEYLIHHFNKLACQPDLVMLGFVLGAEVKILSLLDERSIPLISVNSYISAAQYNELGKPRQKYPLWLGHIAPNDVLVGYDLAQNLLHQYRLNHNCLKDGCRPKMFGFTGISYTAVSKHREKGLSLAIKSDTNSDLLNVVKANWSRELTLDMMETVVGRHQDIDIFWAATDAMAQGVVDGIKQYSYKNKALIGGVDWSPDIIPYIESGDVTVSLGGHFIAAGLALILFYDYEHGIDFMPRYGTILESKMSALNNNNIRKFGPFLIQPIWKKEVLTTYSLFNNPSSNGYLLDPLEIISQQID